MRHTDPYREFRLPDHADTPRRPRVPDQRRLLRAYLVKRLADLQERLDGNPCGNPCDIDAYRADAVRRAELERLARYCRVRLP